VVSRKRKTQLKVRREPNLIVSRMFKLQKKTPPKVRVQREKQSANSATLKRRPRILKILLNTTKLAPRRRIICPSSQKLETKRSNPKIRRLNQILVSCKIHSN